MYFISYSDGRGEVGAFRRLRETCQTDRQGPTARVPRCGGRVVRDRAEGGEKFSRTKFCIGRIVDERVKFWHCVSTRTTHASHPPRARAYVDDQPSNGERSVGGVDD